ncbi:uncharacterized protein H6S33_006893 [Morchella sextelata]|uniref:uncharacterized protein n=1 Tax=Morchella sextelata TaxID=1174677 RepID=UPI001D03E44A|nr:uncharacterized protein H6S33_006893 [Morchella sextelata]KAH0604516.1 hypothetical protein H6S33_006893 [Morchella sextelata]
MKLVVLITHAFEATTYVEELSAYAPQVSLCRFDYFKFKSSFEYNAYINYTPLLIEPHRKDIIESFAAYIHSSMVKTLWWRFVLNDRI